MGCSDLFVQRQASDESLVQGHCILIDCRDLSTIAVKIPKGYSGRRSFFVLVTSNIDLSTSDHALKNDLMGATTIFSHVFCQLSDMFCQIS